MRSVNEIISSHSHLCEEDLIPLLQEMQEELGYLPPESMQSIARAISVPVSKVYGVATFYNQFRFASLGEHVIQVCRGTACHVKGSAEILDHLKTRLRLREDGNSRDGKFSVVTVACIGACSIAPVITVNGEFHGHLTIEKLDRLLDSLENAK